MALINRNEYEYRTGNFDIAIIVSYTVLPVSRVLHARGKGKLGMNNIYYELTTVFNLNTSWTGIDKSE